MTLTRFQIPNDLGAIADAAMPTVAVVLAALLTLWLARLLLAGSRLRTTLANEIVFRIASDPRVRGAIGVPLRRGGATAGIVHRTTDGVTAILSIPVEGPHGKGLLYVRGVRRYERWSFSSMILQFDRHELVLEPRESPLNSAPAAGLQPEWVRLEPVQINAKEKP